MSKVLAVPKFKQRTMIADDYIDNYQKVNGHWCDHAHNPEPYIFRFNESSDANEKIGILFEMLENCYNFRFHKSEKLRLYWSIDRCRLYYNYEDVKCTDDYGNTYNTNNPSVIDAIPIFTLPKTDTNQLISNVDDFLHRIESEYNSEEYEFLIEWAKAYKLAIIDTANEEYKRNIYLPYSCLNYLNADKYVLYILKDRNLNIYYCGEISREEAEMYVKFISGYNPYLHSPIPRIDLSYDLKF